MRNDLLGNVYVWFRTISWWDAQSRVISDVSVSDMDNTHIVGNHAIYFL